MYKHGIENYAWAASKHAKSKRKKTTCAKYSNDTKQNSLVDDKSTKKSEVQATRLPIIIDWLPLDVAESSRRHTIAKKLTQRLAEIELDGPAPNRSLNWMLFFFFFGAEKGGPVDALSTYFAKIDELLEAVPRHCCSEPSAKLNSKLKVQFSLCEFSKWLLMVYKSPRGVDPRSGELYTPRWFRDSDGMHGGYRSPEFAATDDVFFLF